MTDDPKFDVITFLHSLHVYAHFYCICFIEINQRIDVWQWIVNTYLESLNRSTIYKIKTATATKKIMIKTQENFFYVFVFIRRFQCFAFIVMGRKLCGLYKALACQNFHFHFFANQYIYNRPFCLQIRSVSFVFEFIVEPKKNRNWRMHQRMLSYSRSNNFYIASFDLCLFKCLFHI